MAVIERFHGIDRHKHQLTVCVLDASGAQMRALARWLDSHAYVRRIGPRDAVVMEFGTGAFY